MPSSKGTNRIQFNAGASRLLCIESCQPVAIYDLLKEDDVYLTAPGYTPCEYRASGCFVGKDDELVASGCKKMDLFLSGTSPKIEARNFGLSKKLFLLLKVVLTPSVTTTLRAPLHPVTVHVATLTSNSGLHYLCHHLTHFPSQKNHRTFM